MADISSTWIGTVLLVLFVCFFIILLWVMIWDSNRFVVRKYEFFSKKLKKDCRIIFLSDLHNKEYGVENERLLQAIEEQKPDLILIGGDMISAKPGASFQKGAQFIIKCAEKYPVYYALGNHEYRARIYPDVYDTMYPDYMESLKGRHITFLDNESCTLEQFGVRLTGLSIDRKYYKRFMKRKLKEGYLQETVGKADASFFQILSAHNPDYFPDYAAWAPELVLAGHVHGGVVRIPGIGGVLSPAMKLFPHYDGGLYKEAESSMVISRGLGMHTIPIRLFNPGELVVIDLHPQSDKQTHSL